MKLHICKLTCTKSSTRLTNTKKSKTRIESFPYGHCFNLLKLIRTTALSCISMAVIDIYLNVLMVFVVNSFNFSGIRHCIVKLWADAQGLHHSWQNRPK